MYVRNRKFGTRNTRRSCVAAFGLRGGRRWWKMLAVSRPCHALYSLRQQRGYTRDGLAMALWVHMSIYSMRSYIHPLHPPPLVHVDHILSCVCSLFMFGVCVYVILSPKLYSQKIMVWGVGVLHSPPHAVNFHFLPMRWAAQYMFICTKFEYTHSRAHYADRPTAKVKRTSSSIATSDIR